MYFYINITFRYSLLRTLLLSSLCTALFHGILFGQSVDCHFQAAPYPITVIQDDGSQINLIGKGTADHFRQETPDGYTIVKNQLGHYEYARKVNGKLIPSGLKVLQNFGIQALTGHSKIVIPKHLQEELPAQTKSMGASTLQALSPTAGITPSTGEVNMLVILVEFEDYPHQYEVSDYKKVFKGPMAQADQVSFEQYYRKASYGQLNFHVDFTGWYKAKGSIYDYGRQYGYGPSKDLVIEAIRQADKDVDFSKYDNNNDGYVDGVIVLQAGPGAEEGSSRQYIWSHKGSLGTDQYVDGKVLDQYCMVPGVRNTGITDIGVLVHEVGHLMGQPDLYDLSEKTQGIGYWDMMGHGVWAGNGDYPADFSAWTKNQLGWINIQELSAYRDYTLSPAIASADNYYRISTPVKEEYFLLEYRDNRHWEQGIPGSGLAIWHINEKGAQYVGVPKDKVVLDLEEANGEDGLDHDRKGIWNDLFGNDVHQFSDDTYPNSDTYKPGSGSDTYFSGIGLSEIQLDESKDLVSFTYFESYPVQGTFCGSPVAALKENMQKTTDRYYSYTLPKRGKLVFSTSDASIDRVDVVAGENCETVDDFYSAYFGSFSKGTPFRTGIVNKGEVFQIKISQYQTNADSPFTWQLSVESPDVNKGDSLAVVAVLNGTLDASWDKAYKNKPISSWSEVEVENQRVTALSIYSSKTRKDMQIPAELYQLTALKTLSFHNNAGKGLTNGITENISHLTALNILDLSDVVVDGFMDHLSAFKDLEILYIDQGKISGSFPDEMDQLSKLRILKITHAGLESTLPETLGNLTSLESVELNHNQLRGSVPKALGKLKNLRGIDLSYNDLSGKVPGELMQNTSLYALDISYNRLSEIPDNLLSSPALMEINLSGNKIQNFPANIPKADDMYSLDLSHNQISGQIPKEISNRRYTYLDLSYNQIEGHMPKVIFIDKVDVSYNRFTSIGEMEVIPDNLMKPKLMVTHNQLSFDDLLLNESLYPCNCDEFKDKGVFWATTQDSVHLKQEVVVEAEKQLTLDLGIDTKVLNSSYRWYHQDQYIKTTKNSQLIIEDFSKEMEGVYRCEVTHPQFQQAEEKVTLYYDHLTVKSAGRLPQFISVDPVKDKSFGDAAFSIKASNSTDISLKYERVEGPIEVDQEQVVIKGAGKASIKISAAGNEQYDPADTTVNFSIHKASQTITFSQPEDINTQVDSIELDVSSSSGLPVALQMQEVSGRIQGHTVFVEGAGKIALKAIQPGNENYEAAETVIITFQVHKAAQQIVFEKIEDKTYGGQDFELNAYASSGLAVNFKTLTENIRILDGRVSILSAGEVSIMAYQEGDDDFQQASPMTRTFQIEKAQQFITMDSLWDQSIENKQFSFSAKSSSGLPVNIEVLQGAEHVLADDTVFTLLSEGEVTVQVSQHGNENYHAAQPVTQRFTIFNPRKKNQSITVRSEVPEMPETQTAYQYAISTNSGLETTLEIEGPAVWKDHQLTFTGTGEVWIRVSQAGNDIYNAAPGIEHMFRVTDKQKLSQQITYTALDTLLFGQAPRLLSIEATSDLPVTYETSGPIAMHQDSLFILGAGKASLTMLQQGNDTYESASVTVDLTISKASQHLTLEVVAIDDTTFRLQTSSSSGLQVAVAVTAGNAHIQEEWLYVSQPGTVVLTATQSGNLNYEAAQSVSHTLEIQMVLGTDQHLSEEVALRYFPNPVVDIVTLYRDNFQANSRVLLFDGQGRQLLSKEWHGKNLQLDLSVFAEGIYVLYYQPASGVAQSIHLIKSAFTK